MIVVPFRQKVWAFRLRVWARGFAPKGGAGPRAGRQMGVVSKAGPAPILIVFELILFESWFEASRIGRIKRGSR
jgi:hypothetical protein